MPTNLTEDFNRVTLRWAGIFLDGRPCTGRIELAYNGPVMLDVGVIPMSIYPKLITKSLAPAEINGITYGFAEWEVPASNDPDILGSGGTYTVTEKLDGHPGRTYDFIADIAFTDPVYINAIPPSAPVQGVPYTGVTQSQILALDARLDELEESAKVVVVQNYADAGTQPAGTLVVSLSGS